MYVKVTSLHPIVTLMITTTTLSLAHITGNQSATFHGLPVGRDRRFLDHSDGHRQNQETCDDESLLKGRHL